jgi:S1-C subfamily serine protease
MNELARCLRLLALAGAALLASCAGLGSGVSYRDRVFQTETRRSFELVTGEVARRGSAFAIDARGHLLTCAHNLFAGVGSTLDLRSRGRSVSARVVAIHRDLDLALLLAEQPLGATPFELAELPPAMGAELWVVGYPLGSRGEEDARVALGRASESAREAVMDVRGEARLYRDLLGTGAPIAEGWSGGPVLDSEGRVVGMLVLADGRRGKSGAGYALRLSTLHEALADFEEEGALER